MRYIDEKDVASVLRMDDLIQVVRQAMIDFSKGEITQPTRRMLKTSNGGFFGSMPVAGLNALGAKLVTFFPGNVSKKLNTHNAIIVLFHPKTGEPMAIMDGRLITEMRTAAVTASYIDAVADHNVKSLAILGAGTQGKSHIEALSHVRDFKDIRIWNRTPEKAEILADEFNGKVMSRVDALADADVVVVATSSSEPVINGNWLRPGAKVTSVGWAGADGGELDATTMSNLIIVDSREGALAESGNIRRFNPEIYAELGEVLNGSRPVDPNATVVFDSIGIASQDLSAATLVYNKLMDL